MQTLAWASSTMLCLVLFYKVFFKKLVRMGWLYVSKEMAIFYLIFSKFSCL